MHSSSRALYVGSGSLYSLRIITNSEAIYEDRNPRVLSTLWKTPDNHNISSVHRLTIIALWWPEINVFGSHADRIQFTCANNFAILLFFVAISKTAAGNSNELADPQKNLKKKPCFSAKYRHKLHFWSAISTRELVAGDQKGSLSVLNPESTIHSTKTLQFKLKSQCFSRMKYSTSPWSWGGVLIPWTSDAAYGQN
jgi:hypothetical protein